MAVDESDLDLHTIWCHLQAELLDQRWLSLPPVLDPPFSAVVGNDGHRTFFPGCVGFIDPHLDHL